MALCPSASFANSRLDNLLQRSKYCPLPLFKITENGILTHIGIKTADSVSSMDTPLLHMGEQMLLEYCSAGSEWTKILAQDKARLRVNGHIPANLSLTNFVGNSKFYSGYDKDSLRLSWQAHGQRLDLSVLVRREQMTGMDRPAQDSLLRAEFKGQTPSNEALWKRLYAIAKRPTLNWPNFTPAPPNDGLGLSNLDQKALNLELGTLGFVFYSYPQQKDTLGVLNPSKLESYLSRKQASIAHEIIAKDTVRALLLFQDKVFPDMDLWDIVLARDPQGNWSFSAYWQIHTHIPVDNISQLFGSDQHSSKARFELPPLP